MKNFLVIIMVVVISGIFVSCGNKKSSQTDTNEVITYGQHKVEIYYFHGNRRCASCNAIEKVAKQCIEDVYANNDDVKFFTINFEKTENKDIVAKYDIQWSSLIIASGDKSIDLTLDAFQYAMSNPEFLKNEINEVIEDFL
jgi:hypothetical protein